MKLSKKKLLDYDKQGYVIVNNVFSKKDLEELDRAIKNILLIEKTKLDIKKKYENKNNSNKNIFLSAPNQIAKLDKYKLTGLTDTISENMQFKRISSSRKIQSIVNILLKWHYKTPNIPKKWHEFLEALNKKMTEIYFGIPFVHLKLGYGKPKIFGQYVKLKFFKSWVI